MSFKMFGLGLLLLLPSLGLARPLDEHPGKGERNRDNSQNEDVPAQGASSDRRIQSVEKKTTESGESVQEQKHDADFTPPTTEVTPPHYPGAHAR